MTHSDEVIEIPPKQKQWSEMWLQARQEDKLKASALESKAEENAQKILEAVEQVAEAAPSDGSESTNSSEEISEDQVEEILKDNLAVNPDAGLGPFSIWTFTDERQSLAVHILFDVCVRAVLILKTLMSS